MKMRKKMSRDSSRKNFKRGTKVNPKNARVGSKRGGIRL
jgi:hypothetical protein